MSSFFSAEQFEREFKAARLRNWEVPKWYPERPHAKKGFTKIISNDRGHLLPGVPRPPTNPWGDFKGTWQLPKHISRQLATKLSSPRPERVATYLKRSKIEPVIKSEEKENQEQPETKEQEGKEPEVDKACEHTLSDETEKCAVQPYVPGDLTEPKDRYPGYELLCKKRAKTSQVLPEITNMNHRKKESKTRKISKDKNGPPPLAGAYSNFQIAKKMFTENLEHQPLPDTVTDAMFRRLQLNKDPNPGKALPVEPIVSGVGYKGYGASGPTQCTKMKVYRPKTGAPVKKAAPHQQRPSTSTFIKKKYVTPIQLAICWDLIPEDPKDEPKRTTHIDGSNGSAAPAVFAMVHSPKVTADEQEQSNATTPKGSIRSGSFGSDKKSSKSSSKNSAALANQAIKNNPNSPKNSVGSKSASSADKNNCKDGIGCGTPKSNSRSGSHKSRRSACSGPDGCGSDNGSVKSLKCDGVNGCNTPPLVKPAWVAPDENFKNNNNHVGESGSDHNDNNNPRRELHFNNKYRSNSADLKRTIENNNKKNFHQSTPNLLDNSDKLKTCNNNNYQKFSSHKLMRPCVACEVKNSKIYLNDSPKSEYKMAFLAGKPNNGFGFTNDKNRNQVHVPKPRHPYVKKNYCIDTLTPPFSLWPGNRGMDYPEHWRLASIYQHAYKPIQTRKRPLIASVYH